jgi:signal transduction histidine kinase/CheY-like chemotaxis protein
MKPIYDKKKATPEGKFVETPVSQQRLERAGTHSGHTSILSHTLYPEKNLTYDQFFMKRICDKKKAIPEEKVVETPVAKKTSAIGRFLRNQPAQKPISPPAITSSPWKILVVDDEPEIHAVTQLSIGDLVFENKKIQLFNAISAQEAREILSTESDIAVALIDVVMETEDAGLRLVEYIRNELNNRRIRLIIRTGQPGIAPEPYVIDNYDIDDYKDKTELTTQSLYTTLRTALKAYRDLTIIDNNRQSLEKILSAAPELYRIQPMEQFLEGILTQMGSLCPIGKNSLIATRNSALAILDDDSKMIIRMGTGKFVDKNTSLADVIIQTCNAILRGNIPVKPLPENSLLLPMEVYGKILGFIYLEEVGFLTENDQYLLQIMATQCAAALKNLELYTNLEKANRQNERKTQILGMAAHDLRNPLGVIQGYGQILELKVSELLTTKQREYLSGIQTASTFTLRLVNDLLDVAKIESSNMELERELTDLVPVITQGILFNRHFADSKQIQLVFDSDENIPKIMVDSSKIQQVLNNLISNPIKYSHSHTTIKVRLTKDENDIVISVKDEGQGIPENERDQLFQAFSKTSVRGTAGEKSTGLGLLICRQIVEAHCGKIWVESKVDMGSTFYVSLPIESYNHQA